MSSSVTLHFLPLRQHLSLKLELSVLVARLEASKPQQFYYFHSANPAPITKCGPYTTHGNAWLFTELLGILTRVLILGQVLFSTEPPLQSSSYIIMESTATGGIAGCLQSMLQHPSVSGLQDLSMVIPFRLLKLIVGVSKLFVERNTCRSLCQ